MNSPPPDFIIAGAPKCGTTAIWAALKDHPEVYFSCMKEPHYYAFDYPGRREVTTLQDYERLYQDASPGQLRGDASVYYLSSDQAIPAILKARPDVKVVVSIRNPVEMFISWHNELVKALDEDEPDVLRAWLLQNERAQGHKIPRLCKVPASLQYKSMCSLGAQLRRLRGIVPQSQLLVLLHQDMSARPRETYQHLVRFLGIADQGLREFPRENSFSKFDSMLVAKLVRSTVANSLVRNFRAKVKGPLNDRGLHPLGWLIKRYTKPVSKPALPQEFRQRLIAEFSDDVGLIEELLGRDLSDWRMIEPGIVASQ